MKPAILTAAQVVKNTFKLTLRVRYQDFGSFFPPFLWGEKEPVEQAVFNGMEEGFVEEFKQDGPTEFYIWINEGPT